MKDPMVQPRGRGRARRLKAASAVAAAALVPTSLAATPAEGTVVDVVPGHNITVFHNIDMVVATGYEDADELTVRVIRPGVGQIGTATGDAVGDAVEGFGLEVNHGPEGFPQPGDCWEGNVPNIRPGDHIEVDVNGTLTDQVIVDDIRFLPAGPSRFRNTVTVPFNAFRADGTPIPPGFIDSAEFRAASNNQVRFGPEAVVIERRPGAEAGQLRMRYKFPFQPFRNRPEWNQRQLRRALLNDGHAIGFGHVDPLPAEGMLVDGLADTPGPAPGCPGG